MSKILTARGIINWGSLILIILAILISSSACGGIFSLIIENQTAQSLTIYVETKNYGTVEPGRQIIVKENPEDVSRFSIVAKNVQGDTIFSKVLTREQMQKIDVRVYKVIIPPLDKIMISSNTTENK
jgi:hypothetical protein